MMFRTQGFVEYNYNLRHIFLFARLKIVQPAYPHVDLGWRTLWTSCNHLKIIPLSVPLEAATQTI